MVMRISGFAGVVCAGLLSAACASVGDTAPVAASPPVETAPAYMLVLGQIHDREAFMAGYASKLAPLYEKYGGTYLAVTGGPSVEILEGDYSAASVVIGKWKNMEAARAFWNSPEYAPLKAARIDNQWGDFDVILVQGLPEPD